MKAIYAALLAATLAAPLPLAFHSYAMAEDSLGRRQAVEHLNAQAVADKEFSTGDSHGPRQPYPYTDDLPDGFGSGGDLTAYSAACPSPQVLAHTIVCRGEGTGEAPIMLAQAKKPSWEQESWSYEAKSPAGFSDPRPHELDEQIARNNAHARQTIEQLGEDGGCSADVIPYGYAVDCSGFLANNAPFGGADNGQMGSQGD